MEDFLDIIQAIWEECEAEAVEVIKIPEGHEPIIIAPPSTTFTVVAMTHEEIRHARVDGSMAPWSFG